MFDGNGNWVSDFSAISDRDNNIKILASRFDEIFIADLKESFENCLTKDGQTIPVGNFNMGSQKITNLNKGTSSSDAVNKEQLDALWYVGDIKTSTRDSNHGVWFLCNGQEISRTTYPELFELLGTKFGKGDDLTTFNLPDYTNLKIPTNSDVYVYGNGMTLGFISSTDEGASGFGITKTPGDYFRTTNKSYGKPVGTGVGDSNQEHVMKSYGITTDGSKSGIVGSLKSTFTFNYFIKVA